MILNSRAAQEKVVVKLVGDAKERIEGEKKKKDSFIIVVSYLGGCTSIYVLPSSDCPAQSGITSNPGGLRWYGKVFSLWRDGLTAGVHLWLLCDPPSCVATRLSWSTMILIWKQHMGLIET